MKVFKLRLLITLLLSLNLLSSAYAQQLRGVNTSTLKGSEDVDALSAWNVNVIRYQLSMGEAVQTATPAEFLAWLSGELDTLDTLLPLLSSQGISVIIDMHSPPGGFASTQGFPLLSIFSSAESRQTLFDAWDAIASRYSGNSTIFAYELVSEPGTGVKGVNPEWSQLAAELVTAVLAVDANAKFIVAPDYAHFNKLKRVAKSLKNILGTDIYSQHIIHSVHLFFPDKYVNQGLGGKKIGVKYPSKRANKKILRERLKKLGEHSAC
jgi:aryl-phospho-beta-D-glucosidase BglC (GH1 family)